MKRSLLTTVLAAGLLAPGMPAYAGGAPLTNADIVRLAHSGVSDSVLASMVRSESGTYTLTPDAILALKKSGAGDETIKAMLQSGSATRNAASGAAAPGTVAARVSLIDGTRHREFAPALAKIAQSQFNGGGTPGGGAASSMLSGYAGSALSLVPGVGMLGGMVGGIGSLFGHHPKVEAPKIHQVWALEGSHSANELANGRPTFEIAYDNIPGVDPDRFVAAVLHLVPTKDNWRLVGASKTTLDATKSMTGGIDIDSIDEERVAGHVATLGRGRVRFTPDMPLPSGEYAVVIRPADFKSAAEGGGSGQTLSSVIASVWDFSVPGATLPAKP